MQRTAIADFDRAYRFPCFIKRYIIFYDQFRANVNVSAVNVNACMAIIVIRSLTVYVCAVIMVCSDVNLPKVNRAVLRAVDCTV